MQSQSLKNNENPSFSGRLVGAREANAAQRAARAFHLTPVPEVRDDGTLRPLIADLPVARRPETPANDIAAEAKPAAKRTMRKFVAIGLVALVAIAGGGWYGYNWVTVGRFIVSTDDAYVRADATTLAAKVAGYVSAIDSADNSYVHAGDVIARIDDGDYRLAVAAARDKVATQQATVGRIGQQITAQQTAVVQANAQLASAQAVETRTELELQAPAGLGGQGIRQPPGARAGAEQP